MSRARRKKKTARRPPLPPRQDRDRRIPVGQVAALALLVAVVAVVVAGAHWPALSARALSFDDAEYLANNPLVRNPSWASAGRFLSELLEPSTVPGYAQPLAMISLMLDYASGGRPDDLRPFHRTSLALHVANTALLIVFVYQLFGQVWAAAAIGLLFGVHPLTVEPIAWLGERKTLLAAFFVLWCMILYVRYVRTKSRAFYTACLVVYVLALLSKPTSTPLPALLLLLDAWPMRRLSWRAVAEKVPFLVIAALGAAATVIAHHRTAGIALPMEYPPGRAPLMTCYLIVFYLSKIVWPMNLCSVYPTPEPLAVSNPVVLAGVLGTAVLIAGLVVSLRWTRGLVVAWLFFMFALSPMLGVIGYSWVTASDKYMYVPAIGLLLPMAWLLRRCFSPVGQRFRPTVFQAVTLLIVLALAGLEIRRTRSYLVCWQDSEVLFRHMLTVAPDAPQPHNCLGAVLMSRGNLTEAIEHYEAALRAWPDYQNAHNNLAIALSDLGEVEQAIEHYQEALRIKPKHPRTHNNLANALVKVGRIDEAIEHYHEALRQKPDYSKAHNNLGNALLKLGRVDEAIEHCREALRLQPGFSTAHRFLGNALLEKGRIAEAIEHYKQAVQIDPDNAKNHYRLGNALVRDGRLEEAIQAYRQALQVDPQHEEARQALDDVLTERGEG